MSIIWHCFTALLHVTARFDKQIAVKYFRRIVINGEIVHSFDYCKNLKRNSFTVQLYDESFFTIESFIVAGLDGNGENSYAIGHYFETCASPLLKITNVERVFYHTVWL